MSKPLETKLVIGPQLFEGIKYVDYGKRFEELGIKEHYKRGVKKDELIKRAIKVLSEIEAKKLAGEDTDNVSEQSAKQAELDAAEAQAKAQEDEAKKIAEQKEEDDAKAQSEQAEQSSYSDVLKSIATSVLEKALIVAKANLKDAVDSTRKTLLVKSEAIEHELQSRK